MLIEKDNVEKPRRVNETDLTIKAMGQSVSRIFRYSIVRIVTIFLTVGVGLYLTLIVLNLGGFVDEIQEAEIAQSVAGMALTGAFEGMTVEERAETIEKLRWQIEEATGLHEPLPIRTVRWWFNGITLQWGTAERLTTFDKTSNQVRDIIFDRLPYTLLLAGGANIILFFCNLWIAMLLSRHYTKFWDRLFSFLTPISSIPSWIHGVILLAVFAIELRILPFKGMFDGAPPEDTLQYALQLLKHMILPVTAIILSVFFQGVYTWRTFFLVHSGEDYVELAKAKGLPDRIIRRRYILLPTLPSVITNFALMLISFWEGAIALEILFNWNGLGALFLDAIHKFDRPVVVGVVVMFAYLMALSVILLDIIYALVDPRVRVGGNGASIREKSFNRKWKNPFVWIKQLFEKEPSKPLRESTNHFFAETDNNDETKVAKSLSKGTNGFVRDMFLKVFKNFRKSPLAAVGLIVIAVLFIVSVGTVIFIPYDEAVAYWHSERWLLTPRLARPKWTNAFRHEKLPESVYFDSTKATDEVGFTEEWAEVNENMDEVRMTFTFDFSADEFPQDLMVNFSTTYEKKAPFASLVMITPDDREIKIDNFMAVDRYGFILSTQDQTYSYDRGLKAIQKLFGDPAAEYSKPLKGEYEFQVKSYLFEENSEIDVEAVLHGKVFGLFGTDDQRRDLTIALLWGTPVVMTFGILGALMTTLTILLAAISAWYGGFLDQLLQRIVEINYMVPALPIAILVYYLYSQSIWVIMSIVVLINILGNGLKEYRAMFLQLKEEPYIEAALVYGSPDLRIVFKYMLPRIIQVLVPQLVISVPGFVFLETTLAYLGVTTPYLPTWGKVIYAALNKGTFQGHYYWVLQPIALALITGLAFAFVGFALDKILNPRLRDL